MTDKCYIFFWVQIISTGLHILGVKVNHYGGHQHIFSKLAFKSPFT